MNRETLIDYSPKNWGKDISKPSLNEQHPWNEIHLSKSERKGRSYSQLQVLRQQKFAKEKV